MRAAASLQLGASNARVSFSVRWFKVIRVRGSFSGIAGTIAVPGSGSEDAKVTMSVESISVHTGISLRDKHLRGSRFLDSGRHPLIRFESDQVSRHNGVWDVRGRLVLRGLEREVRASVFEDVVLGKDLRLTADFSVPRRPHSVGTASGIRALNPLLWAIADEVYVRVELFVPATILHPTAEAVPAR